MICRNIVFAVIVIVGFSGCDTPKKLQHSIGFSDDCLKSGGDRDQSILYYIRTEECMSLKEPHRLDERCGTLLFVFSKEGEPIGGAFYAWKPAKMEQ